MIRKSLGAAGAFLVMLILSSAAVTPAQAQVLQVLLDKYIADAKAEPGYSGPSVERGRAFFFASHAGGKAGTPSCTSCHAKDLTRPGQTRVGKPIEPMALSVVPTRYTDPANVEKWFKRNCMDVLGRECSAAEKADVLAFLLSL
jgi:cytochrome c peroxidase